MGRQAGREGSENGWGGELLEGAERRGEGKEGRGAADRTHAGRPAGKYATTRASESHQIPGWAGERQAGRRAGTGRQAEAKQHSPEPRMSVSTTKRPSDSRIRPMATPATMRFRGTPVGGQGRGRAGAGAGLGQGRQGEERQGVQGRIHFRWRCQDAAKQLLERQWNERLVQGGLMVCEGVVAGITRVCVHRPGGPPATLRKSTPRTAAAALGPLAFESHIHSPTTCGGVCITPRQGVGPMNG